MIPIFSLRRLTPAEATALLARLFFYVAKRGDA